MPVAMTATGQAVHAPAPSGLLRPSTTWWQVSGNVCSSAMSVSRGQCRRTAATEQLSNINVRACLEDLTGALALPHHQIQIAQLEWQCFIVYAAWPKHGFLVVT